jgi:hypothetical protein
MLFVYVFLGLLLGSGHHYKKALALPSAVHPPVTDTHKPFAHCSLTHVLVPIVSPDYVLNVWEYLVYLHKAY